MYIKKFDFLSNYPHMFIFGKRTNKTLFGGILFIIYIFIMINVTIFYTLDFHFNDKYDIRYSLYKNFNENIITDEEKEKLNPYLNFSVDLYKINNDLTVDNISDNFFLIDFDFNYIYRNTVINRKPTEMSLLVVYLCLESNCTINEEDYTNITYLISISYQGFKIDHQSNNIPLEINIPNYTFYITFYFSYNSSTIASIDWEVISYKEERGILGLFDNYFNDNKEYSAIDIGSIETINTEEVLVSNAFEEEGIRLRILSVIQMKNEHKQYIEYKRTKKSILEILANIGSLFYTIYSAFTFIFRLILLYYDSYIIIQTILNDKKELRNKNIQIIRSKTIKLEDINKKNKDYINNDQQSFNTSKSVPFKSNSDFHMLKKKKINIRNDYINKNINNINNKINNNINNKMKLIGFSFWNYLLYNYYCIPKKKNKNYNNLENCHNILAKYKSIEEILHNQIIFENLMKDYNWNQPDLRWVESNFFINKLKLIT